MEKARKGKKRTLSMAMNVQPKALGAAICHHEEGLEINLIEL